MIRQILIANRGEIAACIIRATAKSSLRRRDQLHQSGGEGESEDIGQAEACPAAP
jgi:hypothetical protein